MRILMSCYEFPPVGGGGAHVAGGLSRALVRLGHEVDVVTMNFRDLPAEENVEGVRVYRIPCVRLHKHVCSAPELASYIISGFIRQRRMIAERKYDLLHSHFIFPDAIISSHLKRKSGLPLVVTPHGSDIPGYNPDRFNVVHTFARPLWRRVVSDIDRLIFPSRSLEDLFLCQKVQKRRDVIPNGVDWLPAPDVEKKKNQILVCTRMFERKGVQYLLRALEGVGHDYEVNIVGDGPYLDTLKQLAERLTVKVTFYGWLEKTSQTFQDLFRSSRIFVFPSIAENCPIVLLEAMRASQAIITTNSTGCGELINDIGLLVGPGNVPELRAGLVELMANPDYCGVLGSKARKRFEEMYTWDAVARSHVAVYEEMLGVKSKKSFVPQNQDFHNNVIALNS